MTDIDAIYEERAKEWRGFHLSPEPCRACQADLPLSGNAVLSTALFSTEVMFRRRKWRARETPDGPCCEFHWVYLSVQCDHCHTGRHLLTSQACIKCEIEISRKMHELLPSSGADLDMYALEIPRQDNYNVWTRRLNAKGQKRIGKRAPVVDSERRRSIRASRGSGTTGTGG